MSRAFVSDEWARPEAVEVQAPEDPATFTKRIEDRLAARAIEETP